MYMISCHTKARGNFVAEDIGQNGIVPCEQGQPYLGQLSSSHPTKSLRVPIYIHSNHRYINMKFIIHEHPLAFYTVLHHRKLNKLIKKKKKSNDISLSFFSIQMTQAFVIIIKKFFFIILLKVTDRIQ